MMETERPRLLSRRPTLAAVMPFPSEEVTPPVTKTYFAIALSPPGFFECYSSDVRSARPTLWLHVRRHRLKVGIGSVDRRDQEDRLVADVLDEAELEIVRGHVLRARRPDGHHDPLPIRSPAR